MVRAAQSAACLLVGLAVIDEIVDHARICEGGGVTKAAELVFGNLAQDAPHDLARTSLGQTGRKLDNIWRGNWADLLADVGHQLLSHHIGWRFSGHQGYVGIDALALDVVRIADDSRLRDALV